MTPHAQFIMSLCIADLCGLFILKAFTTQHGLAKIHPCNLVTINPYQMSTPNGEGMQHLFISEAIKDRG
jgi:hypothetical protein